MFCIQFTSHSTKISYSNVQFTNYFLIVNASGILNEVLISRAVIEMLYLGKSDPKTRSLTGFTPGNPLNKVVR